MNMKRKICSIILSAVVLVSAGLTYAASSNDHIDLMEKLGRIFKNDAETSSTGEIYARGNSGGIITAKDFEKAVQFYLTAGNDETTAREKAEEYLLRRDALYQEAVANGYTVTDAEITEYLSELKETVDTAANKEDVYALMSQFDSEEEYWDYQFKIYRINLPIEKYIQALKEDFYHSQRSTYSEGTAVQDPLADFNNYLDSLKNDLVDAESYTIYN